MNAALAVALAAAVLAAATPSMSPKPIPDAKVGLAKGGPAEVLPPPAVKENDSAPGERAAPPRPFPGAAPVIPHGVSDFLPITKDRNACVDCHAVPEKKKGEATPIPASHYVDLRNAPERRQEKVAGARWTCTACHVPQQDVAPLVKNPFPH